MSIGNDAAIRALLLIFIIVCIVTLLFLLHELRVSYVRETSEKYNKTKKINRKYSFDDELLPRYTFRRRKKSKAQIDNLNEDKFLLSEFHENYDIYCDIIGRLDENKRLYGEYLSEIESLKTCDTATSQEKISPEKYREIERALCDKCLLHPVTSVSFDYKINYTSPKGKSSWTKQIYLMEERIRACIAQERRNQRMQETKEYQRRIMTPNLRYRIMHRDGFRCQICGRTQKEGFRLEVDHILPVSKGGKTVESNLRTLCEECNRGKRDMYDVFGVN